MKCYICDAQLAADDIKFTPKYGRGNFAPCGHCEGIIAEVFEPIPEEELILDDVDLLLDWEEIP